MCNLSWTPHSSLEMDNSLNHSCGSPRMDCLEYELRMSVPEVADVIEDRGLPYVAV